MVLKMINRSNLAWQVIPDLASMWPKRILISVKIANGTGTLLISELAIRPASNICKNHNKLEHYAAYCWHTRWLSQIMELNFIKIDRCFLIEQSVKAANYSKAPKCIEHSSLDRYSLIEQ